MIREKIYAMRALPGRVQRYHTWPMISTQTVGQHACRVAQIYVEVFGMPRAEVLYYCLCHDDGELWSGDLPYGAKRNVPGLRSCMNEAEGIGIKMQGVQIPLLDGQEWAQFKICDLLEMMETGLHELRLGNQYAQPIINDTRAAAQRMAGEYRVSEQVNKWLQVNGEM